jgi:hypothetical protein
MLKKYIDFVQKDEFSNSLEIAGHIETIHNIYELSKEEKSEFISLILKAWKENGFLNNPSNPQGMVDTLRQAPFYEALHNLGGQELIDETFGIK